MHKESIEPFFFTSTQFKTLTKREKRKSVPKHVHQQFVPQQPMKGPCLTHFPSRVNCYHLIRGQLNTYKNSTSSYFCMPKPHGLGLSIPSIKATLHNKKDNTSKNCKPSYRRTKQVHDWTKMVTYVFKWFGTNKLVISLKG